MSCMNYLTAALLDPAQTEDPVIETSHCKLFGSTRAWNVLTEIHSIYPALFLLGRLGRELRHHKGLTLWSLILKKFLASFKTTSWGIETGDETLRDAVKLAKHNARTITRMLLLGILLHGEKVGEKEFFLRRVTALSLYSFGILSALAKISRDTIAGSPTKSDLLILQCFLEEAKEARRGSKRILDTKKEKLGTALFQDLKLNS